MKRKKPEALSSSSGCFRLYADTRLCASVPSARRYGVRVSSQSSVARVDCRYELRSGDRIFATGHLSREQPLEVGDRIEVGGRPGIVRAIEPLLGEHEVRLVLGLVCDRS
jgi:hypothetical protein